MSRNIISKLEIDIIKAQNDMKTMNFCLNMKFRIQTSFISPKKGIFFGTNWPSYALFIPVPGLKVPLLFRKLRKKVVFLFKFLFGYGIVIMD